MGRHAVRDDDDFEDDDDDPEAPDRADQDDDEDDEYTDTRECVHCGAEVYEFADRCPKCGEYASRETPARRTSHPLWVIATAVLLLILFAYSAIRWGF